MIGDVADGVTLPPGGTVTYSATCAVAAGASGSLVNTATVAPPLGVTDPVAGNNAASATVAVVPTTDLAVTKTVAPAAAVAGSTVTYTIVASNAAPGAAPMAAVEDVFPPGQACTWTCAGAGGGDCRSRPVTGDVTDFADLPAGATVTYTATCTFAPTVLGEVCNTATIAPPTGVTDPVAGNNAATACVEVSELESDLAITKDGPATATVGDTIFYTLVASNLGPLAIDGARVTDHLPPALAGVTWVCTGAGGASCPAAGTGDVVDDVDLPVGGTATAEVAFGEPAAQVCNQGQVVPLQILTDDPTLPVGEDATCFAVASLVEVPTLSEWALAVLALLVAALAVRRLGL